MMDTQEIKKQIKGLPFKSRRRIHSLCFDEVLGSWQFVTAFVLGIPCMVAGGIALSNIHGFFGDNHAAIASTAYGVVLTSVLSRQTDRLLGKAYKKFQQEN